MRRANGHIDHADLVFYLALFGGVNAFLLLYLPIVIFLGIAAALGIIFILFAAGIAPRTQIQPDNCRTCSQ